MTDPLASELSLVESLSKHFAVALGLVYLLGFLVVASYLSRYGVSSFSVLQLQYLVAGIWVLGPPVAHAALMLAARQLDMRPESEIEGKFNWRGMTISSLFSVISSVLFMALLIAIPYVVEGMTWSTVIRLLLFYVMMVKCALMFWRSRQADTSKEAWWINRGHAAPFYLASLFVIVVSYALWFSVRVYPLIPFSLGGGRPLTVVFIEGEKRMPDEIERTNRSAKRSIPYKLLLSTDRYYVVVSPSPKERSMEISRDTVAGMVVLE
jgi:hypothetical protein